MTVAPEEAGEEPEQQSESTKHEEHKKNEVRPIPLGKVMIDGGYCGTVTTATHCMQVSIPLGYEIPISAILPALAAFKEAAELAADEAETEEEQKEDRLRQKMWTDLLAIFQNDTVDISKVEEEDRKSGENRPRPYKIKYEALLVDYEIRGKYLAEAERQKKILQEECASMRNSINSNIYNQFKYEVTGKEAVPESEVDKEAEFDFFTAQAALRNSTNETTLAELNAHLEKKKQSEEKDLSPVAEKAEKLSVAPAATAGYSVGPDVNLRGAFMGDITCSTHCLSISLPIEGLLPCQLVLEAIRSLRASNPPRESGEEEGPRLIEPTVFDQLETIFYQECLLGGQPRPQAPVTQSEAAPPPTSTGPEYDLSAIASEKPSDEASGFLPMYGQEPAPTVKRDLEEPVPIVKRDLEEPAPTVKRDLEEPVPSVKSEIPEQYGFQEAQPRVSNETAPGMVVENHPKTQYYTLDDDNEAVAQMTQEAERAALAADAAAENISKAEARVLDMTNQVKQMAEVNRVSAASLAESQREVRLLKAEVQRMLPLKVVQNKWKNTPVPSLRSLGEAKETSHSPEREMDNWHEWFSGSSKPPSGRTSPPLARSLMTGSGGAVAGSTLSSSPPPSSKCPTSPDSGRVSLGRHVKEFQRLAEEMRREVAGMNI